MFLRGGKKRERQVCKSTGKRGEKKRRDNYGHKLFISKRLIVRRKLDPNIHREKTKVDPHSKAKASHDHARMS